MSEFTDWREDERALEFNFPLEPVEKVSFSEWLWRETRLNIRNLPEISYDEIPELLE